eukprot:TRINITY_DN2290_c0_g2_i2.p1 TRINITY_DN2290_c0_g2~~TRINITY_DN2290_c0_g2_i2.p1  ORF type:complete len:152 (-),score=24.11 TRINITY_DN2290_c0_g2_i2:741-1196(-)
MVQQKSSPAKDNITAVKGLGVVSDPVITVDPPKEAEFVLPTSRTKKKRARRRNTCTPDGTPIKKRLRNDPYSPTDKNFVLKLTQLTTESSVVEGSSTPLPSLLGAGSKSKKLSPLGLPPPTLSIKNRKLPQSSLTSFIPKGLDNSKLGSSR